MSEKLEFVFLRAKRMLLLSVVRLRIVNTDGK